MVSKADNTCAAKLENIENELLKIDEKILDYDESRRKTFSSVESQLNTLQASIDAAEDLLDVRQNINTCVASVKSKMSEMVKIHRDVHVPISKFGKLVDKSFVDDLSHLTAYFTNDDKKESKKLRISIKAGVNTSVPQNTSLSSKTPDDLLRLVLIEHLLREGHESVATDLMHNFNFTEEEIGIEKFKELSALVSAIHRGDLNYAKKWLSDNQHQLGSKSRQLEYALAKLDFLSVMQREPVDPANVIQSARQLVPFATEYSTDFEHLMGSLVFIGRSLEDTPYADLALPFNHSSTSCSILESNSSNTNNVNLCDENEDISMEDGNSSMCSNLLKPKTDGNNALSDAANLFKSCCCYQSNLSDVDPLFTAFSSGCKVLTRLHSLQRAIACLGKYSPLDGDMLPVAVNLDPEAQRHNIFHCPVIKEVTAESNGPVRLTCGHAISRDAFNSLVTGDRSRMKCPYCPVETTKSQVLDLIF